MIKCKCNITTLTYKDFDKLQNLKRANPYKNDLGRLFKDDTFECDIDTANYLFGDNPLRKRVIDIIEIIPEEKDR